ncbi:MAG: GNAT family N-acetyltransferase [Saprospiraceae bacterium]
MSKKYLFESERLGFRNWVEADLPEFAALNADPDVMEHFPYTLSYAQSEASLLKFRTHFNERGYCYFATDVLESETFIGFIGLAYQDYPATFTPATDIGWRLKQTAWGKGFATEGANRCLDFAFNDLKLNHIVSVCTKRNTRSEHVMQKIGMTKKGDFLHPALTEFPDHQECMWYQIDKDEHAP